jgi:two-component system sensor histidine kinase CiaH
MNITKQLKSVSRKFVIIIVSLSVISVAILSFVLYETNAIRFGGDVSNEQLYSVVDGNQELVKYLEDEKKYEAHFLAIASLVKLDQQKAVGDALIAATIIVSIVVAVASYFVARYLLRPVRDAYESQERFIQDAAHEIRNPLAAMSLALENVQKSNYDKSLITTMKRQTKRLIRINEDLLYLERRSTGQDLKNINISELFEDVLEDLQPSIVNKKIKIKRQIQKNISLKIDPKDFIKLVRNITENAVKYSNRGGTVEVVIGQQSKRVIVSVKDYGIGIPQEDISHIGERFFRSKNATSIDGTGLGMAIVSKVLKIYGGSISIDSKLGQGTTVSISL